MKKIRLFLYLFVFILTILQVNAQTCPAPSALTATSITATSADLGWTENGTATTWDIEWGTAGFTPSGVPNIVGTTTNPHNLTGLFPQTDYDFYVRSNCGLSGTSTWAGPHTFTTRCLAQLSGTYTIGTSGDYANFTAAVNDLSSLGVCGPVVFNVLPGSGPFNEQITIPLIIGASATNTITFNGNGETITFLTTSSPGNYIIRLDGATYITFDSLNVVTQTTLNNFAIHLTNNADFNTINNCAVNLSSTFSNTSTSNAGIVVSGSLTSATTAGSSGANNTFTNNHIIGGYYGLTINGASSTNTSLNNIIENNTIEDFRLYGVYLKSISNSNISFNDISRPNRTSNLSTFYGIYFNTGGEGNTIEGNKIHDPFRSLGGVSTSSSYAVYHSGVDAVINENRVINNLIYNMNSNGTIYALYNSSSDGVYYYHNTISLDDQNATGGTTRGFYQTTTASNIEFKNNIITVTRGGTGTKYCIYFASTTSTISSNNNVFYMNAPAGTNNLGYYGGSQATLSNWQTATSGDANSVDADPLYINLAVDNFTPTSPLVDGIADATVGVSMDIFGTTRATNPDPGAIEFTPPSCPQPSNLNAMNITGFAADLSWLETGSATTWQLDWDTAGVALGNGNLLMTTTNPHSLTGLSPQSEYRYYVRSICTPGDTSFWAGPFVFTTLCVNFNAPWLDDVETHALTTNSTIENCWSSSPSGTTSSFRWNIGSGSTPSINTGPSAAYSGSNYFHVEASSGSIGDIAELYTPFIDVTSLTTPELQFYYHMYGSDIATLFIDVFNGNNWIAVDSIIGQRHSSLSDPWSQHNIVINGFPDTLQVRFRAIRGASYEGDISIDDIEIFQSAASCIQPSNLAATNITTTSADLSWTENGTATTWDIEWGTAGFTPTGTPTIVGTTTNPHNLTGLTASTSYDFYVRSDCGASGTSTWAGPFTFTTTTPASCVQPSNLAATNITTSSADLSWTENGTATTWDIEWGTTGFTPTGTPTIVGTTTNPHNLTGLTASTSYDFYVRSDCGASGTSTWAGPFTFTTLASCVQPSNLAATNITTSSADLSWTENGTATTWDIEWGTAGFTPTGTPTIVGTTTNPHNLTGLTASTSYDFYVRSDCGASGTSTWAGPFTFTTTTPASCVQPSNLAATNITTSSADLSWTENGTATTWDIEWGTAGFTPTGTPTIVGTTTNPHNLTGLTASTSYDFYVRSDCGASGTSTWSGPFTFTTTTSASCVQPSNLAATNITTNSADLSWTENGTATTWDIEWGTAGFTPTGTPTIVGTTTNPHNLTGLTASTSYDFYVRSDCGASGTSTWAGPFTFTTTTPASCVQPSNLAATNITTSSADLSWTENGTATTWDIEWGTTGFTPTGTPTIVGTTTNPHNLTGLTASTSYDFYVRSDCGASGTSTWAGPFTFTTLGSCVQPSNLAATNITTTSADLSWTENGTATTWDIEWGTAGFTPTGTPNIVGTTTNPHNLSGLTASTSYDFYVRSDCGASGTSSWAGPFTFTTLGSCVQPSNLAATNITTTSADLSWTENGTATTWDIEWGTAGFTPTGTPNIVGTTTNPHNLSGLTASTSYDFYVRSDCGASGTSTWAGPFTFTTLGSCVQPSNLAATNITTTSADLSWTENGTATTWDIEWGTAGFTPTGTPTIVGTTTNPHNLTGLTASTSYDFYVRSDCGASGTSTWAGPFTFTTTTPASCVQPSNLAATNITTSSADLSWTENGTATTWDIEWGTTGFTPTGTPTIVGTTTNPHNLTGLTASTSYDFYVRSDCGASGTSTWAGPFTFTTPPCMPIGLDLGVDTTVCSKDSILLDAGSGGNYTYSWSTGGTAQTELIDTALMGGNGTYNVSVTVTDVVTGCMYTDDINITFQLCTDIDELGNANAIAIYPNPTKGVLNVMINGSTVNTTLTIVDVQGKVVYSKNNFTNSTSLVETIDLSGNDKGVYFIRLTTDKTTVVKKVILH